MFAYGLRNPFRFSLVARHAATPLYIGDVGWNTWEEIDVATGGENFGWPCWEGPLDVRNNYYHDSATKPTCDAAYANPPANLKGPLYWWDHVEPTATPPRLGGAFAVGRRLRGVLGRLLLR